MTLITTTPPQLLCRKAAPVDGIVIDGRTALDESMVTGESMPVAGNALRLRAARL